MKITSIFYIILCILCCSLPLIGMTVAPTTTTTENKELAALPSLQEENSSWNQKYLSELGDYFSDHFAFRNQLVTADSMINTRVFGISTSDSIVIGQKGWLYYSATLDNYLGKNLMTDRQIKNIANNLRLTKEYVEGRGKEFLFVVPPNKNSLYGEYMPITEQYKMSEEKNIDKLAEQLEQLDIPYLDLFQLFRQQDEILYYKRDSHWNTKGAMLVYNALLDKLQVKHNTYADSKTTMVNDYIGDLNSMLYPKGAVPEADTVYELNETYTYTTPTQSVEEAIIETANKKAKGSLLMYRDSFGNSLLPLMANAFKNGAFMKTIPYNLAMHMDFYDPDIVIAEKVERNLKEFYEDPPVFEGADVTEQIPQDVAGTTENENAQAQAVIQASEPEANMMYWQFEGTLPTEADRVYVRFTGADAKEAVVYEAFTTSTEETDTAYRLYMDKESLPEDQVWAEVIIEKDGQYQCVGTENIMISEIPVS